VPCVPGLFLSRYFYPVRWTNHFPHPADNRYEVFAFREPERAEDFRGRCDAAHIPYESDHEGTEILFGIHKDHRARAIEINHLVSAAHRKPFIPHPGLRWAVLLITLVAVLIGLAGALLQARAQPSHVLEWGASVFAPAPWAGVESIVAEGDGLTCEWAPAWGSGFGARITTPFRGAWSWSTGIQLARLRGSWNLRHASGLEGELVLRSVRYRIPLLAGTRVPLTQRATVHAMFGPVLDFMPSDAVTSGDARMDTVYHSFTARESRIRGWSVPLSAEVGISWRNRDDQPGLYLGAFFSQEIARNRWGEAAWGAGSAPVQSVRFWSGLAAAGLDFRVILP
jgi:hypothetical protein